MIPVRGRGSDRFEYRAFLKANPTPQPPPRSIGEGERSIRRWDFMFIFVSFSK